MNKQNHKIVFNKSRGCLMAVAETAASQCKGASGERKGQTSNGYTGMNAVLGALAWACKLASGAVVLSVATACLAPVAMQAQAQTVATRIVADPAASRTQQATILRSANGVVQVDIQTPSAAGVSRNVYNQFDVGQQGAILNNSRTSTQTQLGGWVQGNPWLSTGTARVIVNEVNASNPSQLRGMMEVAGNKAEVVIANPSGLVIDGAGFINASRVTLTTGTPVWNNGNLDSYRVSSGTLTIDGQGLDSRGADYTAILARAVQVNAGLWAKALQVVTGTNQITAASLSEGMTPQTQGIQATGPAPTYAIDVAQLGGMYAGKIMLLGTEAGVGVRNAALVQASSGPLTLSHDGWLQNSGSMTASGDLQIRATGNMSNSGLIYAGGNAQISTASQSHSGTTAAQGDLSLTASGQIQSTAQALLAAGLRSDGTLLGSHRLNAQASTQAQLLGQSVASGALQVNAQSVDVHGARMSAAQLNMAASQGDILASDARIQSEGTLSLSTPGQINTDRARVQAQSMSVSAHDVSNIQGQWAQSGEQALRIELPGTLDNSGGTLQSNANEMTLKAASLINQGGQILQAGSTQLSLQAASLDNRDGQIKTNAALVADIEAGVRNNQGLVHAQGDARVQAQSIDNTQGRISSAQSTRVLTRQELDNTQGVIAGGKHLTLQTAALNNTQGTLVASTGQLQATSSQGGLVNHLGQIQAAQNITLTLQNGASTLDNRLDNSAGKIQALGDLRVNAAAIDNQQGLLSAAQSMSVDTQGQSLNNQGGQILAATDITLITGVLDNTASQIRAGQSLAITASEVRNSQTLVRNADNTLADKGLQAQNIEVASAKVDNTQGVMRASELLGIYSDGQINNTGGLLSAGQALQVAADVASTPSARLNNAEGQIVAERWVDLQLGQLQGAGQVQSQGDVSLSLQGDHTAQGTLRAGRDLTISATGTFTNPLPLHAGRHLSMSAANIDNTATGELVAGATARVQALASLTNRGLIDGADTRLQAKDITNIGTGRIYGDRIAIAADTLTNREETVGGVLKSATIAARERLDIGVKTLTNREGALIFSAGDMAIGGQLDANWHATGQAQSVNNNSATLEALGNLSINAQSVRNTNEHYATELRPWGTAANYFYIQPNGSSQKYLESAFTKWTNGELTKYSWATPAGDPVAGKTPLPTPRTEQSCNGEGESAVCTYVPGTEYPASDPAWAYFKITPPPDEPTKPTLTEPVAPVLIEPTAPSGADSCKTGSASYNVAQCTLYNQQLAQYNSDKAAYDKAWSDYNSAKATYDSAWAKYNDDLRQWDAADDAAFAALTDKIATYNASFQSGSFVNWTQYKFTRTFEKSVVTQTAPGQIVAGGQIRIDGTSLLNDKSQIVAGGTLLASVDSLQNLQGPGQFLTHDDGTVQGHGTRTVRPGLRAKKTKDRWDALLPYHDTVTEDIELPVVVYQANASQAGTGASATTKQQAAAVQAQAAGLGAASALRAGTSVSPIKVPGAGNSQIITQPLPGNIPNTSLYRQHPESTASYLVETDPQFAGYRNWLGSDYLLSAYGQNPNAMQKRLGDGYYEQKLVREQVMALTGNRYLGDYSSDEAQYMALMNSGLTYARAMNLRPGVALSPEQMAQLTSDMVWLVSQEVTLADGSKQSVLVPQVYVRVKGGDLDGAGALLAGRDVNLQLSGDLSNGGTIAGRKTLAITAENIRNLAGTVSGGSVDLQARQDIDNTGGVIQGESALKLQAGRDLNVSSTVRTNTTDSGATAISHTGIERMAGLYVKGEVGTLVASAGRDINLTAAAVGNQGTGPTVLAAGNNLNLNTVTTASSQNITQDANNYIRQSQSQDVGSQMRRFRVLAGGCQAWRLWVSLSNG